MATYLTRTPSAGTHGTTWTISFWFKNTSADESQEQYLYMGGDNSTSNNMWIRFQGGTGQLYFRNRSGGSNNTLLTTNRVFRDVNAWYHIVYALDGNNSTQGDRVRLYVNGVRETSFSSETYPSQGTGFYIGASGDSMDIGRRTDGSAYSDTKLLMSHYHIIDGTAYNADTFGSTDATTGEWKINTSPSVTYGTNGCFILKDGNSVTDQSGQGNNWTVSGTLTKTEDCPSNVFATLNPLCNGSNTTLSHGNNVSTGNTASDSGMSTITLPVASSGKFYCEMKIGNQTSNYPKAGIFKNWDGVTQGTMNGGSGGALALNTFIQGTTTITSDDGNITITAPTNGDVIMFALDTVNGKFYIGNNGTWLNSGDPTSGATGTGSVLNLTSGNTNMIATHEYNGSISNWNFGNGYFGTTAVSSAGTNASGNGIFEYDVPSGYTALSTKGLNL
jgi:hypothetical protein